MRRLLLLRHAKSDWPETNTRDLDRPLNARGRDAALLIGNYMARHRFVPDRAMVSTAARARETWDTLAEAFRRPPPVVFDERLYNAGPESSLELIKETPREARSLLVIGHNPGLQELAVRLVATGNIDARQLLVEKFPTAGLAIIDFAVDDWTRLHWNGGRLERLITPRALTSIPD